MTEKSKRGLDEFTAFRDLHWNRGPTQLQIVISAHLYVENGLDDALLAILPYDKDIAKLSFSNKVVLASSIGFGEKDIKVLKQLNTLRNKYAHNLEYEIKWSDVTAFPVETDYKKKDWDENATYVVRGVLSAAIGYTDACFEIHKKKQLVSGS